MARAIPIIPYDKVNLKHEVVDDATSGDNTIVAAVTGKQICLVAGVLIAAGEATARFESGAGGTALTGQMSLNTNTGFAASANSNGGLIIPQFCTDAGALLNLELSAAVNISGWILYFEW